MEEDIELEENKDKKSVPGVDTFKDMAVALSDMLSDFEEKDLEEIIIDLQKEKAASTDKKRQNEIDKLIKISEILLKQRQIVDYELEKAVKDQEKTAFGYDEDVDVMDQEKIDKAKDALEVEAVKAEVKKKKKKRKEKEQEFVDLPDELKDLEIKEKKTKDGKELGKVEPREKGGMEHHTQRIR